jgi:nucleotide-binding universal stress UspA family protein
MKKLLVAVDGSGAAQRAFGQAIALARMSPDASIHLVRLKDSNVRYTKEVLTGPIGQTIARHAERLGCDAIVMGRHGKTTIGDLFMGSVAMKVLHLTRLPVLLVR